MKQKRQRGAASEAGGGCLLLVEAGAGGGGGQEVEGIEACVRDKWPDRCGQRVRQQGRQSLSVWVEGGLNRTGISRGAFNPLEGETWEF